MSDTSSQIPGYQRFFAELKRRRVFRVMAVYGATGFVVLQVADLLAEGMDLPDVVLRTATFLVLIGFPIAVALAWAFDVTPDGVKKTEDAEPGELTEIIEAPRSARWPAGVLALVGVAALVWGAWFVGKRAGESGAETAGAPESARLATASTASPIATAQPDDGRRTIAVLPFDDLTGGAETEPFAVGVHDDLLTQLSKIRALKVTSRTSVKEYRDTEKSIPEIATELGVETVLEGGVQRSGNQVRINVQLIDPATDEHLWAETYDAELTAENVFAIQSQIARSVADALEAELSPDENRELEVVPSRDLDALAAYHAGKAAWEDRGPALQDSLALAGFERAVKLDPGFADAWAGLSMILSWKAQGLTSVDLGLARDAIAKTDSLAPGSASVELARGYYAYYVEREFDTALEHFRTADRLRPSDAGITVAIAYILRRQGDYEGAIREIWRAIELDPRNPGIYSNQAETLGALRRFQTADAVVERGLLIDPRNTGLIGQKIDLLVRLDRNTTRAQSYASEISLRVPDDLTLAVARASLAWIDGNGEEALRLVESVPTASTFEELVHQLQVGFIQLSRDNREASREAGEAVERIALEELNDMAGTREGILAIASALQSDTTEARDQALEARTLAHESGDRMAGPRTIQTAATALAMVGDHAGAAWMFRELATVPSGTPTVADLELVPGFGGFRASPEYPAVLAAFEAAEAEGARLDAEAGY